MKRLIILVLFVCGCTLSYRVSDEREVGQGDVKAGNQYWYRQNLLKWIENANQGSEFIKKKDAVVVRLSREFPSCDEYASYSNGYVSGYAFYETVGTPLPGIFSSVDTNVVHKAFVKGWDSGELDAQRKTFVIRDLTKKPLP